MNNLTTKNISFLNDIDPAINIDYSEKTYYYKMFRIELDDICNFIGNLKDNEIYLIDPVISMNYKITDPYITLSMQFLVTNNSNPILIYEYLISQFGKARNDFNFHDDYYFLLKYKLIEHIISF
jgi:hypothetical protein